MNFIKLNPIRTVLLLLFLFAFFGVVNIQAADSKKKSNDSKTIVKNKERRDTKKNVLEKTSKAKKSKKLTKIVKVVGPWEPVGNIDIRSQSDEAVKKKSAKKGGKKPAAKS